MLQDTAVAARLEGYLETYAGFLEAVLVTLRQHTCYSCYSYLEAVSVGQANGLFALPGKSFPAHAQAHAKLRYCRGGFGRPQRVGRQRCLDHAFSQGVQWVCCAENIVVAHGPHMLSRIGLR